MIHHFNKFKCSINSWLSDKTPLLVFQKRLVDQRGLLVHPISLLNKNIFDLLLPPGEREAANNLKHY